MAVQIKRFGWLKRPTAWEYAQAWRAQRSTMVQRFREDAALAASAFAGAQNNLSVGLATLAAQASVKRSQGQLAALRSQAAGAANQINLSA
jgi:hypothetical protein